MSLSRDDVIDQAEDEWFDAVAEAHAAWNKLGMLAREDGWFDPRYPFGIRR